MNLQQKWRKKHNLIIYKKKQIPLSQGICFFMHKIYNVTININKLWKINKFEIKLYYQTDFRD